MQKVFLHGFCQLPNHNYINYITMTQQSSHEPSVCADCRMLQLDWYFVSADLTTSRTRSSAYIGYECRKGLCSRSQCRLTGHCTVMPLSTFGSLHKSLASRPDKDSGLPNRTICAFLLSDCMPTVGRRAFTVAGARVWNDLPADVTSAPSLSTFRKRLKLHLFPLFYPGLVL